MLIITLTTVVVFAAGCGEDKSTQQYQVKGSSAAEYQFPMTFSAAGLPFCSSGSCSYSSAPGACSGVIMFDDFTIFSETSGSFFSSIQETILIDEGNQSVTLTTNQTSHQGMSFSFSYIQASDLFEVTYAPNCGRLYRQVN